jgi:predicted nucleic acid-binding protein
MHEYRRLVLDANIMVSALLGKSFPFLIRLVERDVLLMAPEPQFEETRKTLGNRPAATAHWADAQIERIKTIVAQLPATMYARHEQASRARLNSRGQSDWPVLAVSYETAAAIWSHDHDFFGSGAPVWSTFMLRRQMDMIDA